MTGPPVTPIGPIQRGPTPVVRRLGVVAYGQALEAMRRFTGARDGGTPDEIWLLQHPPVYTRGQRQAGLAPESTPADIPVVQADRGGLTTYHGPGQLVAYVLLDLRRLGWGVKEVVRRLEQAVMDLLEGYGLAGRRRPGAPGVYVDGAKVAALGLRVRGGCCYHGLSLNVDMDLAPFQHIVPCGLQGLRVTQLRDLGVGEDLDRVADALLHHLARRLWGAGSLSGQARTGFPAGC